MPNIPTIPPAVARKLGHYVYLYVNPLDGSVFYVGKGKGSRALAHLTDGAKEPVKKVIRQIRAAGQEPKIEILSHGLPSAEVALQVEAAAIDLIGVDNLANGVRGWHGRSFGRMPVTELVAHYSERRAKIDEPSILIRINRNYRYGMTDVELYDATRSAWKVGPRAEEAKYAIAVFESVVREVYEITHWLPGGSTFNNRNDGRYKPREGRWEFVGTLAGDELRERLVNRSVAHLFAKGSQNPISYVGFE